MRAHSPSQPTRNPELGTRKLEWLAGDKRLRGRRIHDEPHAGGGVKFFGAFGEDFYLVGRDALQRVFFRTHWDAEHRVPTGIGGDDIARERGDALDQLGAGRSIGRTRRELKRACIGKDRQRTESYQDRRTACLRGFQPQSPPRARCPR